MRSLHSPSSTLQLRAVSLLIPSSLSCWRFKTNSGTKHRLTSPKDTRPHVAVLASSYAKSSSVHKQLDTFHATPQHWVSRRFPYRFTSHDLHKANCIEEVNKLISTGDIHCFFNLCDGAEGEDRAGVEIIQMLQRLNLPFTGTGLHSYEPSKVAMKMLVAHGGVKAPSFALLHQGQQNLARAIRHLRFPIFIKPVSGYGSCGITAESKCANMDEFLRRIPNYLSTYSQALVEEFIEGREGTVLVSVDRHSLGGTHLCPPIVIRCPGGSKGFLHLDAKWKSDSVVYQQDPTELTRSDPAYSAIMDMAHNACKLIMGNKGYARIDFRIDRDNRPFFIEINPNCALFYPKYAGDWGDTMIKLDKQWTHEDFIKTQIEHALEDAASQQPWWSMATMGRLFVAKANHSVPKNTPVFGDRTQSMVPLAGRILQHHNRSSSVKRSMKRQLPGCVVHKADDPNIFISLSHSCNPNLAFLQGTSFGLVAKRSLQKGDVLTVDVATLRDHSMNSFLCNCGSSMCRGTIKAQETQLRQSPRNK